MHRGQERKQGGRHSWFEGKRGVRSWDAGYVCSGWGREGGQPLCGGDGRRPHPEERVHCWGHRTDGGSEAVQRRALDARQLDFLTGLYFLPWRSSHWGDSQMSYPAPHQCASLTYLILREGSFRLQSQGSFKVTRSQNPSLPHAPQIRFLRPSSHFALKPWSHLTLNLLSNLEHLNCEVFILAFKTHYDLNSI